MQTDRIAAKYSNAKSMLLLEAAGLSMTFPGTEMLLLVAFLEENSLIYDFKTSMFAPIVTHPDSKRLIIEYLSAPDTESSNDKEAPESSKADDGNILNEVPMFRFKRAENGSMAIMDQERYDLLFPQFKNHVMRKVVKFSQIPKAQVVFLVSNGPGLVAAFTTPKFLPLLTQPEGWGTIKACLETPANGETIA
ncbi:unnamed protein product [Mortierella alpina]